MNDLVTENADLEQQQTTAEETIRREQQQMRQLEQVRGTLGIFPFSTAMSPLL